jgi:hypothetical protein
MSDGGTWGGGVEIAAATALPRGPRLHRGPLRPCCLVPLGPEVPTIPILTVPTIPTGLTGLMGRTGRTGLTGLTGPLFRLGRWACGIPARTTHPCSEDRKKDWPRYHRGRS